MHGGIAMEVLQLVRNHLDQKYVPRNQRGDFWADVRNTTTSTADDKSANVSLNELGINLRYNGGDVTPGKSISSWTGELTRTLAVPSDKVPIVDGRQIRPGRAGILHFLRARTRGDTVGFLVEGEEKEIARGKNKGKKGTKAKEGGDLLYTLRTITRHKGDKGILPPQDKVSDAAKQATALFIDSYEG